MKQRALSSEAGFSLVRLMTVHAVILVLRRHFAFLFEASAYKPDDESLLVTDILQESPPALMTSRTMLVEINLSNNTARLVDENQNATTPDDDVVLQSR